MKTGLNFCALNALSGLKSRGPLHRQAGSPDASDSRAACGTAHPGTEAATAPAAGIHVLDTLLPAKVVAVRYSYFSRISHIMSSKSDATQEEFITRSAPGCAYVHSASFPVFLAERIDSRHCQSRTSFRPQCIEKNWFY